LTLTQADE
jgi:hypothetical protein